jgi:hypothetical protein
MKRHGMKEIGEMITMMTEIEEMILEILEVGLMMTETGENVHLLMTMAIEAIRLERDVGLQMT